MIMDFFADTGNRLLRAAREAEHSHSRGYEDIVDSIQDDHIQAAETFIRSPKIVGDISKAISNECQELKGFLAAAQKVGEISPKSIDKIISRGENLSARYVTALLQDRGVDSQFIDLSEVMRFGTVHGLDQDFYDHLAKTLGKEIEKCKEKVPVITGFFGPIPGGLLDQIGRGYTDLCAALVAVGVGAEELQVWKEVPGIFTAGQFSKPPAIRHSDISKTLERCLQHD